MARVYGAHEMIDITGAHIDITIYVGDAGLEFAERLAQAGGKVAVPSTLNVSGLDEEHWREWSVPSDWAEKARRQMIAYQKMGTIPTWTCAPYQTEHAPKLGQQIAWGESNAIRLRELGPRRPNRTLSRLSRHLRRHHRARSRVGPASRREPRGTDRPRSPGGPGIDSRCATTSTPFSDRSWDVAPKSGFPVLVNVAASPTGDQLKALGAAAASAGGIGLYHWVGVTPEAPTLDEALAHRAPEARFDISVEELSATHRVLTTTSATKLDLVVLGSPHFSLEEFRQLAPLLDGKTRSAHVEFLVTTSRIMSELAGAAGCLEPLTQFGGKLTVDTCILATPMLPRTVKTLMTNSGKYTFLV